MSSCTGEYQVYCPVNEPKLELELIQSHMAQKPMLRGEVGARALRVRSDVRGQRSTARDAYLDKPSQEVRGQLAKQSSSEGSVAWSWDLAHVHCTVKYFPKHVLHPKSTRKVILKNYMRDIIHLI